MTEVQELIKSLVDRETNCWNTQNAADLVEIFHPDMMWSWPPTAKDHNPEDWILGFGRYNRERWQGNWQGLFDSFELVHNLREIVCIKTTEEEDGGFAVVDIDTLWRNKETGEEDHWKGRVCKMYTKTADGWKLIAHTGVLDYSIVDT